MSEVIDLDIMVPDAKRVKFGGEEYDVPADMPMEIFLRINRSVEGEDQAAELERLVDALADLFTWDQLETDPTVAAPIRDRVRAVIMHRGTRYGFGLIRAIYKADDEAEEAAAEERPTGDQAPPAEASSGTTSTTTSPAPTTPTVIRAADIPAS